MDWIDSVGTPTMDDLDILGLSFITTSETEDGQDCGIPRKEQALLATTTTTTTTTNVYTQKEEKLFDGDYQHHDENYMSLSQSAATSIYATSPLVTLNETLADESSTCPPTVTTTAVTPITTVIGETKSEESLENDSGDEEVLRFMEEPVVTQKTVDPRESVSLALPRNITTPDVSLGEPDNCTRQLPVVQEEGEAGEMIVELPHPDVLEKLYPQPTKADLQWENVLAEKPILMFEESTTAYTNEESDQEDFDLSRVKVYIKKKEMTRGRNYALSVLRGATHQYLKLYRREYKRHMKILLALKEEIERHGNASSKHK